MIIYVLICFLSAFVCDIDLIDSSSVLHFPICEMAFFFLHQRSLDHNYEIRHRNGIKCCDGRANVDWIFLVDVSVPPCTFPFGSDYWNCPLFQLQILCPCFHFCAFQHSVTSTLLVFVSHPRAIWQPKSVKLDLSSNSDSKWPPSWKWGKVCVHINKQKPFS